jgi:hypothetical protein
MYSPVADLEPHFPTKKFKMTSNYGTLNDFHNGGPATVTKSNNYMCTDVNGRQDVYYSADFDHLL